MAIVNKALLKCNIGIDIKAKSICQLYKIFFVKEQTQ